MAELGYGVLSAVVTEIIVICLSIALKHDKRKVMIILILGTLLAGIIGFRLPIYLCRRENAPLLFHCSFPSFELTEPISETQVVEKLDTIWTYKARGIVHTTSGFGKSVLHLPGELEYTRPYRLHSMLTYPDGKNDETITVGDRSCNRYGQGGWFCGDRESFPVREWTIQEWIGIVKEQASSNEVGAANHGVRVYIWRNKECRLYYKIQFDPWDSAKETFAVCIDPDTLLPVKYSYRREWLDAPDLPAKIEEFDVFDINQPIDILLPAQ